MSKFIDLTGQKFNRLTVIKRVENSKKGDVRWLCQCECGNSKIIAGDSLKAGMTKSCGCYNKEIASKRLKTHGLTKTRLYRIWSHIKERCYNPNHDAYKNYGGRGIKMCSEWLSDFVNFYNWAIINGYADNLTIDRINNNSDYNPKNCHWVNRTYQNRNRRNTIKFTYENESKTLQEWAEIKNIKYHTLYQRVYKLNWTIEKAITENLQYIHTQHSHLNSSP
jgi:hypothetical protein